MSTKNNGFRGCKRHSLKCSAYLRNTFGPVLNNTNTDVIGFGTDELSWSPYVRYLIVNVVEDQKLSFKQHVYIVLS